MAVLCAEVRAGHLWHSRHYTSRLLERAMPDRSQVKYVLCDDDPEVIQRSEDARGRSCLIWGIMSGGRVAHVLCSPPPNPVVITAYWPDTDAEEWTDNYKRGV